MKGFIARTLTHNTVEYISRATGKSYYLTQFHKDSPCLISCVQSQLFEKTETREYAFELIEAEDKIDSSESIAK
jgi:hypothetical protein